MLGRYERQQRSDEQRCQRESEPAGADRHNQTFHQRLAHQSRPRCAERSPDREFPSSGFEFDQLQVRDVDADEQRAICCATVVAMR